MPKTKKQLSTELGVKAAQYKRLDTMLERLHKRVVEYKDAVKEQDEASLGMSQSAANRAAGKVQIAKKRVLAQKQAFLNTFGSELSKQVKSFFTGPKSSDDETVGKWVHENYAMARVCMSSDLLYEKPYLPSLRKLGISEAQMHAAAQMAKMYIVKHIPDCGALCWGSDTYKKETPDDYQRYMSVDLYELKENNTEFLKAEEGGVEEVQEELVSGIANSNDVEEESFEAFAEELKNAKTTVNSSEYKAIISTLEQLDKPGLGPWGEKAGLTPMQNEAAKLLTVKMCIDKYIAHKSNDGVKKNVYEKLAAVEKLNNYISKKIVESNPKEFGEPLAKLNKYINSAKQNVYLQYKQADITNSVEKARSAGVVTTADECTNTLKCMQRIIDGAAPAKRAALKTTQEEFFNHPGKDSVGKVLDESRKSVDNSMSI